MGALGGAHLNKQPANVFAVCLRCNEQITDCAKCGPSILGVLRKSSEYTTNIPNQKW